MEKIRELQIAVSKAENLAENLVQTREEFFNYDKDNEYRLSEDGEIFEDDTLKINEILEDLQNNWNDLEELINTLKNE
tara:strand:+ start:4468 stop:4701 length:234 start_codon:yes stop_codon:yes gene_type:complete